MTTKAGLLKESVKLLGSYSKLPNVLLLYKHEIAVQNNVKPAALTKGCSKNLLENYLIAWEMWNSYLVLLALNFHDIIFDFMRQSITDGFWRWGLSLLQLPWTDYSLRTVLASLNTMRVLTDSDEIVLFGFDRSLWKTEIFFLTSQKLIKPL